MPMRIVVINAKSAPYINIPYCYMMFFQCILKLIDAIAQCRKVVHIEYLASNMEMQTDEFNILHLLRTLNNGQHIPHSYAEFVLSKPGFYIGMCVCADVRVDTKAYIGHLILFLCQFVNDFKLGNTLYIEAENRGFECQIYFPVGLAYACKYNFISRKTSFDCSLNFSSAHAIGA